MNLVQDISAVAAERIKNCLPFRAAFRRRVRY